MSPEKQMIENFLEKYNALHTKKANEKPTKNKPFLQSQSIHTVQRKAARPKIPKRKKRRRDTTSRGIKVVGSEGVLVGSVASVECGLRRYYFGRSLVALSHKLDEIAETGRFL